MSRGLRDRGAAWWSIPAALSIGATLGFVAVAAPHWTHRSAIPLAISVRPEAAVSPASSASPRPHRRHPHPAPTVTVTDTESPVAEPTAVTVITPSRPVVVATPTHRGDYGGGDNGGSDDGHGGSDDGHDDGGGGHGGDN